MTQEEVEAGEAKLATQKHMPYIFMQVLSLYKPRAKAQSQDTLLGSDYCCTNTRSLTTMNAQTQRTRPCLRTPPRTRDQRRSPRTLEASRRFMLYTLTPGYQRGEKKMSQDSRIYRKGILETPLSPARATSDSLICLCSIVNFIFFKSCLLGTCWFS